MPDLLTTVSRGFIPSGMVTVVLPAFTLSTRSTKYSVRTDYGLFPEGSPEMSINTKATCRPVTLHGKWIPMAEVT